MADSTYLQAGYCVPDVNGTFAVALPRKVVGCTCDHAFLQNSSVNTTSNPMAGTGNLISGIQFGIDASGRLFFPFSYIRRSGILKCTEPSPRRAVLNNEEGHVLRRQARESNILEIPLSFTLELETAKVCTFLCAALGLNHLVCVLHCLTWIY
jgi:hypothetical protein